MKACRILQTLLRVTISFSVLATLALDGILIRDLRHLERQLAPQAKHIFFSFPQSSLSEQPSQQQLRTQTPQDPSRPIPLLLPRSSTADKSRHPRRHRNNHRRSLNDTLHNDTVPMLLVPDFAALILVAYWIWDTASGERQVGRERRAGCLWRREPLDSLEDPTGTDDIPPDRSRGLWSSCRGRMRTRRRARRLTRSDEERLGDAVDNATANSIPLRSQSQQPRSIPAVSAQGRRLIRDNVYHTLCRVVSSICLVALTIYQPVLYMVQLQDELYQDHITQDCSSSYDGSSNVQEGIILGKNNHFCLIFRTRLVLTFVWAFLVLSELVVAYAAGELCTGTDQDDEMSISSDNEERGET